MTDEPSTLTGHMEAEVRKAFRRNDNGLYEGRIATAPVGNFVYVTSRPATGGRHRLGPCPVSFHGDDPPVVGDRCWIQRDEGGQWAVKVWAASSSTTRRPRVTGASTNRRRRGLALMSRVWRVADSYFGRPGAAMPRVRFGDDIFVGWSVDPPGDLARILATGEIIWPDFVNRGFIDDPEPGDLSESVAQMLLIHEWAHAFQKANLTIVEAEGGAQAFTREFAPDIYAALGITYTNPALGSDQYDTIDDTTNSGHAFGATGWVLDNRSEEWILDGQFRS
jgi:hypothetical protein